MKKYFILIFFAIAPVIFAANVPIQRVDVVNLLGSPGSSQTAVVVSFSSGGIPCHTVTLLYQGTLTVWAGNGQNCINPVDSMTITPIAQSSGQILYDTPFYPVDINSTRYLNLLTVMQDSPPQFDPTNGALIMPGTIKTLVEVH